MSLFGMSDPFVIAGYIGCILTVVACCVWAVFWKEKDETEDPMDEGEE